MQRKPQSREISLLLSNERLILRETQRAVTPPGGTAVFSVGICIPPAIAGGTNTPGTLPRG